MPSKFVPTTIYELWNGAKPNLGNLRPWGCTSYVHNTSHRYGKLGLRENKNVFIRYSYYSKDYILYVEHPHGESTKIESCNVNFMENVFPSIGEVKKKKKKKVLKFMSCKRKQQNL